MRLIAAGLFSFAIMCGTAAAQAQTRPHLKLLTDVPESQLFLVMNAVAGSLGVGCDYCHVRTPPAKPTDEGGWLWDRDDKPTKAKGLEMMRMVRELNASRFGGREVVTCQTCHQGRRVPARLSPLPPARTANYLPGIAAPASALPSSQDVWRKYVAAVGGADAVAKFTSTVLEGRDERSEERRGTFEIAFKGADRYRLDLRMAGQPAVAQAFSADAAWFDGGSGARPLPADAAARLRRLAARYGPLKVLDPPDAWRIVGVETIRGREAYVAEVAGSPVRTYCFDTASSLLVRERTTTETALVPLQEQVDYEDYRAVDGVQLPFIVRTSDDSPWDTSTRTFTSIRHDVALDDALFAVPPARPQPPPASAPPQQPAPPSPTAGARYKSVRVLAEMPAASMIPTMAFIANSLGVTCAHCHTDVYESDEKPMKEKARQMIRMMRAINDAQFGGRRAVTCQTCHNGQAVPSVTPHVEQSGWNRAAAPAPAPLPSVADVLQRFERAVGVEKLKVLRGQKATGTITRNNGRTAPASDVFELTQELPRTLRLSTALSHPPEGDGELSMLFLRPPMLATTYPDLRVVGRDALTGEAVLVLEGHRASGGPIHRLYFSEGTGLLVRRADEIETPLGALPERYDFSDFRDVDGVNVPMKIVWSRADYQVTFAVSTVEHAPPAR